MPRRRWREGVFHLSLKRSSAKHDEAPGTSMSTKAGADCQGLCSALSTTTTTTIIITVIIMIMVTITIDRPRPSRRRVVSRLPGPEARSGSSESPLSTARVRPPRMAQNQRQLRNEPATPHKEAIIRGEASALEAISLHTRSRCGVLCQNHTLSRPMHLSWIFRFAKSQ